MNHSNSNDANLFHSPSASGKATATMIQHDSHKGPWRNTARWFAYLLATVWLILLHASIADGVPVGGLVNAHVALITIACVLPMVLSLRSPLTWLLACPLLVLAGATLWALWVTLWTVPPYLRLPPSEYLF